MIEPGARTTAGARPVLPRDGEGPDGGRRRTVDQAELPADPLDRASVRARSIDKLRTGPYARRVAVVPDSLLEDAARRFALLSDPTRLRVVNALHEAGEISVGALAERTGIAVASVSQHLNRLAAGGLVGRRREGTRIKYRITDPTVEELCRVVCAGFDGQGA